MVQNIAECDVFNLSELCGKEENERAPNSKKLPVIFIDGIDELFFKTDYPGVEDSVKARFNVEYRKRRNRESWAYVALPQPKGFGNHLRANLHQPRKAIFYGTVNHPEEIESLATIENYEYLFYAGNFKSVHLQQIKQENRL